jgi:hypothetical protein
LKNFFRDWTYISKSFGEGRISDRMRVIRASRGNPKIICATASVLKKISEETKKDFQQKYKEREHGTTDGKYFDLTPHLLRSMFEAYSLGLFVNSKTKRVLDLGTGAGYFPLTCRFLGHDDFSIDKPGRTIYPYIRDQLSIKTAEWEITPEQPLPYFDQPFDLITAFQPVFFLYGQGEYGHPWTPSKWNKFFSAIKNKISENGALFIGENDMSRASQAEKKAMLDCFVERNGRKCFSGWLFYKETL